MLETTLRAEYVPGTNLRGDLVGANWTYMLPSLELDRVVCVGAPSKAALGALARLARSVSVVGANPAPGRGLAEWAERNGYGNVRIGDGRPSPADVVVVAGTPPDPGADWTDRLRAGGAVYAEGRAGRIPRCLHGRGPVREMWLTPLRGEMRTAVPHTDRRMIQYFVRNRLYFPTFDMRRLKKLAGADGSRLSSRGDSVGARPRKQSTGDAFRLLGHAALRLGARAEAAIVSHAVCGRWLGRAGFLAADANGGPPGYLQRIAAGAGLETGGWSWGLAAHGQYSSRKVLFFLFAGETEHTPCAVVKLTRDARLNPRLENEGRALRVLEEKRVSGVPRVVFEGVHADLAVLGESAVAGVPFSVRTSSRPGCRHAQSAIDWIVALGRATAEPARAGEAADALRALHRRFIELYRPPPAESAFLGSQVDAVAESHHPCPTVFQHGDAGAWNVFVTDQDTVAFLDWEAAEPRGMPLWDLFHFARSFAVACGRAKGRAGALLALETELFRDGPLGRFLLDSVRRYCSATGLHATLVEPLFHTCWMHRALKEATRLPPGALDTAHYLAVLRSGMDRRGEGTLRSLFAAAGEVGKPAYSTRTIFRTSRKSPAVRR